jgi:hypothetical protein
MKQRGIDELRLRTLFRRAILVAMAGAGCGTKAADAVVSADDDAGVDASTSTTNDAGAPGADAGKEGSPFDPCQATPYQPSPPDTCGDYVKYPCGLPPGLSLRGDCYFAVNDCAALCLDIHYNCHAIEGYCRVSTADASDPDANLDGVVVPDEAGAVVIDCSICPGSAGRVPAGLARGEDVVARSLLGAYYANAARLEAASVASFRRLREELSLHGAPGELVDAARAAERDEVRHTLAMARLARRHGGRYVRPHVHAVAPRTLAEIAAENAVEGCARETFGALLATWQAELAGDGETARVTGEIARDETRHAALSWAVARWSLAELGDATREAIAQSWREAIDALAADADADAEGDAVAEAMAQAASLPSAAERRVMAAQLRGAWSTLLAA